MRIISGKWRGKKILSPALSTRPTADRTREMIFNVLHHHPELGGGVMAKRIVLDVFAGTGALGLEALSRGAQSATFIENHPEALTILTKNIASFPKENLTIIKTNALSLSQAPHPFDLIFLDPPYNQEFIPPALEQLVTKQWICPDATLILETGKEEVLHLPSFLTLITQRVSGRAKVLFAKYTHSTDPGEVPEG